MRQKQKALPPIGDHVDNCICLSDFESFSGLRKIINIFREITEEQKINASKSSAIAYRAFFQSSYL